MKKDDTQPERLTDADFARTCSRDTPMLRNLAELALSVEEQKKKALADAAYLLNGVRLYCYRTGVSFEDAVKMAEATLIDSLD